MNFIRELLYRIKLGQGNLAIARDMHLSRTTVRKYRQQAEGQGYLDRSKPLPDVTVLAATLGPTPEPPRNVSGVAPFKEVVEKLLDQGVEMTAILDRLRENHGYKGSYSSINSAASSAGTA